VESFQAADPFINQTIKHMSNRNTYPKSKIDLGEIAIPLIVIGLILSMIAFLLIPVFGGLNINFSEGQRTGRIYKVSTKGLFFKTHEGELSLQLTTRGSEGGLVNQIFYFSVSDPKVALELEAAAIESKPVTVHYRQYLLRGYRYGSTGYDVDRVIASPPAVR